MDRNYGERVHGGVEYHCAHVLHAAQQNISSKRKKHRLTILIIFGIVVDEFLLQESRRACFVVVFFLGAKSKEKVRYRVPR